MREEPIARLEGTEDGLLGGIVFINGGALARQAMFFNTQFAGETADVGKKSSFTDAD